MCVCACVCVCGDMRRHPRDTRITDTCRRPELDHPRIESEIRIRKFERARFNVSVVQLVVLFALSK